MQTTIPFVKAGMIFKRLTTISPCRSDGQRAWVCSCICGNKSVVKEYLLRKGLTTSCGCRKYEAALENCEKRKTHGDRYTPEWKSWSSMKERCLNPRHKSFSKYGGRGIKVCREWMQSYESFIIHMGRRPTIRHSLERINVNGNYEPTNCKWATHTEQQRNKNNNRTITAFGIKKTLIEWAEDVRCEPSYATLWRRLKNKWRPIQAITTPVRGR